MSEPTLPARRPTIAEVFTNQRQQALEKQVLALQKQLYAVCLLWEAASDEHANYIAECGSLIETKKRQADESVTEHAGFSAWLLEAARHMCTASRTFKRQAKPVIGAHMNKASRDALHDQRDEVLRVISDEYNGMWDVDISVHDFSPPAFVSAAAKVEGVLARAEQSTAKPKGSTVGPADKDRAKEHGQPAQSAHEQGNGDDKEAVGNSTES